MSNCLCFCCFFIGYAKVVHAGNFVVGVEDLHYYPYFDFTPTVNNPSFAKALLDEFAKDNGHQITYLALPIKQFPKWLNEQSIDFKYPDNERWQSDKELDITFSDDVVTLIAGTLVLAKNQSKGISTYKNIGTITGFQPTTWMDKIAKGEVALFEDPNPRILVQYLLKGLLDGVDIDLVVVKNELQKLQQKVQVVYSPHIPPQVYAYKLSTVKYPQIIKQFNQWQVQKREFIQGLKDEFGILPIESQTTNVAN